MRPVVVSVGPLASAAANNIATSQTPTSGTALTLNGSLASGGVATLDVARRVLLTFGSEASARTVLLTGTNASGNAISETLAVASGGASTIASVLDYKTVTSMVPAGGGFSAAVTVGTNGVAASPWVRMDDYSFGPTTIAAVASGTVNFTLQYSADDPNSLSNPVAPADMVWISSPVTAMVGASATQFATIDAPPAFMRVLLNSGTGSVRTTITQLASPTI